MFQIHNYMVGKVLSKGQFSSIRYTRSQNNNKEYISKCMNKKTVSQEMLMNESSLAPLLSHPNILPVREVIDTQKMLFQVTDLCQNGDLLSYITAGHSLNPVSAMHQVLLAINYLHTHFICHRDIKLENIMIGNDKHLKLADFGLAAISFDGTVSGSCGSYQYVAPEALREAPYNGFKADIWSAGVVAYSIIAKRFPYKDVSNAANIDFSAIDEKWCPLIRRMLSIDPNERPTAKQCLQNSVFNSQIPYFRQFEPINISAPFNFRNLDVISRVAQIFSKSVKQINAEIAKVGPSEIKLFTALFLEKEKKNADGFFISPLRCQSCPIPALPRICDIVVRKYSADSSDVLKKIKDFVLPLNGCISMPTTALRSIVLNTPTETESVEFKCSMYDDNETEVCFNQYNVNQSFVQDICNILDSSFIRI